MLRRNFVKPEIYIITSIITAFVFILGYIDVISRELATKISIVLLVFLMLYSFFSYYQNNN